MNSTQRHHVARTAILLLLAVSLSSCAHQGASTAKLTATIRSSQYVAMRDGTHIAVDVYLPRVDAGLSDGPLPAVLMYTPYFRGIKTPNGRIMSVVDSPIGEAFAGAGYVQVVADIRGTGASFGAQEGIFTPVEGRDGYDIVEWIAAQPWCDGNVGMIGGSYDGTSQLITAAEAPPHLKAIFPAMAVVDLYALVYHGGIPYDVFLVTGDEMQVERIEELGSYAAPVDGDSGADLVRTARAQHLEDRGRRALWPMFEPLRYRDSVDAFTNQQPYIEWSPSGRFEEISTSGVAVYIYAGWFDLFTRDAFVLYANLEGPRKLTVVDTAHKGRSSAELLEFYISEQIRWFDYWLKGRENGVMEEPPIRLQEIEGSLTALAGLETWPNDPESRVTYYLQSGPSGGADTGNGGGLEQAISNGAPEDVYRMRTDTTSGKTSRWANAHSNPFSYPDMSKNDSKGLSYTTEPLEEEVIVLGHPIMTLWCSLNQRDADVFIYLEDISPDGKSLYVTEGVLRASHRKIDTPAHDYISLPYHPHTSESVVPVEAGEPFEMIVDLLPTYYTFGAGHRIRITITGSDRDNVTPAESVEATELKVLHSDIYTSNIMLPRKRN